MRGVVVKRKTLAGLRFVTITSSLTAMLKALFKHASVGKSDFADDAEQPRLSVVTCHLPTLCKN
jgi:hypothetical protein